ncbi:MAG: HAD hydrolase-like protein [Candidatus Aureabacteria bacterium]|nr:HAD hydrolase-like protein [Candidatus Auribacterota bacterium]
MDRKTEAVIFDNDNTIAKIYPNPKVYWSDVFVKTVEECGGSVPKGREEEYMLSYFTNKGFIEKLQTIGLKTTWDKFQQAKGVVDERERVKYILAGNSKLFPDAVEFMRVLHGEGIKYAVATFTTRNVVLEAFKHTPGLPPPDAIFDWNDSLRDKLEKPDPRIARIVLDKLGVAPENAMMVGDRLTDVLMGNMAGMRTALVKRREEDGALVEQMEKEIELARLDPETCHKVPDYQVTDLMQIREIL